MTIISKITDDTCYVIFSDLSPKDLTKCCLVSKAWNSFASQDCFWRLPGIRDHVSSDLKKVVLSNSVFSIQSLEKSCVDFVATLPFLNARFTCIFPYHPNCTFVARLHDSSLTLDRQIRTVFFLGSLETDHSKGTAGFSNPQAAHPLQTYSLQVAHGGCGLFDPTSRLEDAAKKKIKQFEQELSGQSWTLARKIGLIVGGIGIVGGGLYLFNRSSTA